MGSVVALGNYYNPTPTSTSFVQFGCKSMKVETQEDGEGSSIENNGEITE